MNREVDAKTSAYNDNHLSFQIHHQPPSCVVIDEWLDCEIGLNVAKSTFASNIEKGDKELENNIFVCVDVVQQRDPSSQDVNDIHECIPKLVTEPELPLRISLSKKPPKVKLRIKMLSEDGLTNNFTRQPLHLRVSQRTSRDNCEPNTVKPILSESFRLATTKLHVETETWDDVWYKDEGGREKCLQVSVSLRDGKNNVVPNRSVPLKFTLLYDNKSILKVMRQEILHVFGPTKQSISAQTGNAIVRFRIEDVSKNHQGQNFKLYIEADNDGISDIAPVCSPTVSVRSKRNKRQRTMSSGKHDSSNQRSDSSIFSVNIGSQSHGKFIDKSNDNPLIGTSVPIINNFGQDIDIQKLHEAMRGVVKWTFVLQTSTISSYPRNPDGSCDYNHPYHSMQNPNACISKILSMYTESTRDQLRHLISAVENTRHDPSTSRGNNPIPSGSAHLNQSSSSPLHLRRNPNSGEQTVRPSFESQHLAQYRMHQPNTSNSLQDQYDKNRSDSFSPFDPPWPGQFTQSKVGTSSTKNTLATALHSTNQPVMPSIQKNSHLGLNSPSPSPMQQNQLDDVDVEDRHEEVAYVLATEYVSVVNNGKLGFPAYTLTKELLGFYHESKVKVGSPVFTPISRLRNEVGPLEMTQATQVLEDHIRKNSKAVYKLSEWGTINNLFDHVMLYDWSNSRKSSENSLGYYNM